MTTYHRRKFLKHSAALLGGVVTQHAFANSLVWQSLNGLVSARPLRMLVLGDSITWGQGLKEEHKFYHLVGEWLCQKRNKGACPSQTNQDVQIHVEAHSGATIFKYQDGDKKIKDKFPGEVPHRNPTVMAQIKLAAKYYRERSIAANTVDLIFVNGGINDMRAMRLFVPLLFSPSIAEEANKYCNEKMALVLGQLTDTFPNARIVIPSYLPLISEKTSGAALLEILKMTFASQNQAVEGLLQDEDMRKLIGGFGISKLFPRTVLHKFTKLSNRWSEASTAAFRQAADKFNLKPLLPVSRVTASGVVTSAFDKRVLVAEVPFKPDNAYGAPDTYFWKLRRVDESLDCTDPEFATDVTSEDELFRERPCMCEKSGKANDIHCLRAGFMHPNREGAKAYRDAIVKELETILPFTGWM